MSNKIAVNSPDSPDDGRNEGRNSLVRPVGVTKELVEVINSYKAIQKTLDTAMPDCIITIKGKRFRKKNYWRGVKTAFNLSVECGKEEFIKLEDDWGYNVIYKAIAPNGVYAFGDGSCSYKEKAIGDMKPTLHNIRAQAHTRAFNRAVSNLVGFGEVSAEEMVTDVKNEGKKETQSYKGKNSPQEGREEVYRFNNATISEKEAEMLNYTRQQHFADTKITKDMFNIFIGLYGAKSLKDIRKKDFPEILEALKSEQKFNDLSIWKEEQQSEKGVDV